MNRNSLNLFVVGLLTWGILSSPSSLFAQAVPFSPETLEDVKDALESVIDGNAKFPNAGVTVSGKLNLVGAATIPGKELFEKVWEPGKPLHDGADGIGPLFNERSCVACHSQGGIGGGGGVDKNVDILSFQKRATPSQLTRLTDYHSGFRSPTNGFLKSIVLHRFGLDRGLSYDEYSEKRDAVLGNHVSFDTSEMDVKRLQRMLETKPRQTVVVKDDIPMIHTQRNSTALFGAGLIDRIPGSAIVAEAIRQEKSGKVSGRPAQLRNRTGLGGVFAVGKFGWRAQQATLVDFVEGACAVELGLDTGRQRQATDPRRPNYRSRKADLTHMDVMGLAKFVSSLEKPRESVSANHSIVERGRMLFDSVGCADCHLPKLAEVEGIYSDLLLHDMGKSLADPAPARDALERHATVFHQMIAAQEKNPMNRARFVTSDGVTLANYYGFETERLNPIVDLEVREREWRTPPLWGVADSAPYMHDGRAGTLTEAIAYHDGESKTSKINFLKLATADQKALLAFMGNLKAPKKN